MLNSDDSRTYRWSVFLVAVVLVIIMAISYASATWRPEYASQPQEIQDWYANAELTEAAKQRFHFKKCCDKSEVIRSRFRVNKKDGSDVWEYLLPDGRWKVIPPDIVHEGKSAPGGQPTLFVLPSGTETCFFPGEGGL